MLGSGWACGTWPRGSGGVHSVISSHHKQQQHCGSSSRRSRDSPAGNRAASSSVLRCVWDDVGLQAESSCMYRHERVHGRREGELSYSCAKYGSDVSGTCYLNDRAAYVHTAEPCIIEGRWNAATSRRPYTSAARAWPTYVHRASFQALAWIPRSMLAAATTSTMHAIPSCICLHQKLIGATLRVAR